MESLWRRMVAIAMGTCLGLALMAMPAAASAVYTVKPGDTLFWIGQRYDVPTDQLRLDNQIWDGYIYPGQALYLGGDHLYQVQDGDSLFLIAQWFNTSVDGIMDYNGLYSSYIYPGQILVIPRTVAYTTYQANSNDLYLLGQIIHAESADQPYEGQVGVGAVIINRTRDYRFPDTIAGVIFEPWQFEPVMNGAFYNYPSQTALRAAQDALNGWDPTYGALYFFNPDKTWDWWMRTRPVTVIIGDHVFTV